MSAGAGWGNLAGESRAVSYGVIFGVWAEVFVFCLLHDQYLIRLAPEHFTVYHPPLWGIEDLTWLAVAWAFKASIGPGVPLGLLALFVGRTGRRPVVPVKSILLGVVPALVVIELCGLAAGAWSWFTGRALFPEMLYPEMTRALITSQSIQLACYLAGLVAGVVYLAWLGRKRRRAGMSASLD